MRKKERLLPIKSKTVAAKKLYSNYRSQYSQINGAKLRSKLEKKLPKSKSFDGTDFNQVKYYNYQKMSYFARKCLK